MRKTPKAPGEKIVKDIKCATRKHYSSEEKISIVLDWLRGEDSLGLSEYLLGRRFRDLSHNARLLAGYDVSSQIW